MIFGLCVKTNGLVVVVSSCPHNNKHIVISKPVITVIVNAGVSMTEGSRAEGSCF